MSGQPAKLLRLYVNEQDRYGGKLLYEAIVDRCRELKVAGATVLRALEGFGETAELHHSHLLQKDQPIVITIVENPEKANQTLPVLEEMMSSGVIASRTWKSPTFRTERALPFRKYGYCPAITGALYLNRRMSCGGKKMN